MAAWLMVSIFGPQSRSHLESNAGCDPAGVNDCMKTRGEVGVFGGTLVISQRSEPKTLNPLIANDGSSREIIGLFTADLIHINRYTQLPEPALAMSWTTSVDRRRYTLQLRRGLRFSDGHPFDADDVIFSFQCYLDEKVHSPQRDLLVISGVPISLRKIDQSTVVFTLAQPYAAAERLFDSFAILPRHLLEQSYSQKKLAGAWGLTTPPEQIAGLGPFRLKQYVPGQRIVLERNPYYWKKDLNLRTLPYLAKIETLFAGSGDAEAMRFDAGDTDVISRLDAADFAVLEKDQRQRGFHLYDLGPGLEYDFLFFNENALPPGTWPSLEQKQSWFSETAFRQAISNAIDRDSLVRLAYRGRAQPLSVPVSAGNRLWVDHKIPPPSRSSDQARRLLRSAGFSWNADGSLVGPNGTLVTFSLAFNAGKPAPAQMAVLIQQDLKALGIRVALDPLEFHTLLDRVFTSFKYEAAIIGLADGDSDPNPELNVLSSNGSDHVWSLKPGNLPPWQREIDKLMQEQLYAPNYQVRKSIYDRVQELLWKNVPVICLISPDILVGAKDKVGNFRPAILSNSTLWNAEQLFVRQ
ncbi:MAG: ABC transporter substrate-binding protein [Acidobacteriota bacterium]|nr:ABC transporter substrate-binding protein [Acidobacteriota bacterium]